jgi:hypothetical protein
MPRFVILEHDYPTLHWDFMLESGDILRTWRLTEVPWPNRIVPAEQIGDHRLVYLDYEGPVSGGRGAVTRWDFGDFEWVIDDRDYLLAVLRGIRLHVNVWLDRNDGNHWILSVFERRDYEK